MQTEALEKLLEAYSQTMQLGALGVVFLLVIVIILMILVFRKLIDLDSVERVATEKTTQALLSVMADSKAQSQAIVQAIGDNTKTVNRFAEELQMLASITQDASRVMRQLTQGLEGVRQEVSTLATASEEVKQTVDENTEGIRGQQETLLQILAQLEEMRTTLDNGFQTINEKLDIGAEQHERTRERIQTAQNEVNAAITELRKSLTNEPKEEKKDKGERND